MHTTKLIFRQKEQKFLMAENGSPKKPVGGHEKLLRASLYFYILVKKCWKGTVFF